MNKNLYHIAVVALFFITAITQAQVGITPSNENYIFTRSYQIPMASPSGITTSKDVQESITYFDGLGRPMQNIAIKASPLSQDIVTHITYDPLGRQVKQYLPYTNPTGTTSGTYTPGNIALTNTLNQYSTPRPGYETTTNPYNEKLYEASPLDRILKQAAPGNDWAIGNGHEVKFDYQTNTATEVLKYGVKLDPATAQYKLVQDSNIYYNAGQLYKTITKDENWTTTDGDNKTTQEFKDKEGRVVLKRTFASSVVNGIATSTNHDTQYVYDDYGNLSYVIPPLVDRATFISNLVIPSVQECLNDYDDFYMKIPMRDIIEDNGNVTGGGGISITINNGILEIKIDVGCNPSKMIKYLNIPIETTVNNESTNYHTLPKKIPDYYIGKLNNEGHTAEIKDGYFKLYSNSIPTHSLMCAPKTFEYRTCTPTIPVSIANQSVLDNLCYQYRYDYRNRLIEKKLPGKGWEYIVYDKLDRPILTQHANLKTKNQWQFTKYDPLGRVVYTGIYTNATQTTRADVQTLASASTTLYEGRQTAPSTINNSTIYYSNSAFPTTGIDLLTINYYDNYNFDLNGGTSETSYSITPTTQTRSLATGSKVRILDTCSIL
jgi:Domain of unknown function (DUF6443)